MLIKFTQASLLRAPCVTSAVHNLLCSSLLSPTEALRIQSYDE
jgi:hypothetical protein